MPATLSQLEIPLQEVKIAPLLSMHLADEIGGDVANSEAILKNLSGLRPPLPGQTHVGAFDDLEIGRDLNQDGFGPRDSIIHLTSKKLSPVELGLIGLLRSHVQRLVQRQSVVTGFQAIFDPLGNAVHTALSFPVLGEDVMITGAGPIGIMAAAVVRHAGARYVVITDINPSRLVLAKKMKPTLVLDARTERIADAQKRLGMKEGFDVGLEMSGSPDAFREMLKRDSALRLTQGIACGADISTVELDD